MGSYMDRYIEAHSLGWDIENSACNNCPHLKKEGCQYYYGNCLNGGD